MRIKKKDQSLFQTVRFSEWQRTSHPPVFIITLRDAPGDYNDGNSGTIFRTHAVFLGKLIFAQTFPHIKFQVH